MRAADDLLRPDEGMTDELRGLSAALHRVGYNSNQVARRRELDIEVTKALAGLARQGAEHSAEWACPLRSRLELGPRQLAGVGEEGADGPDGGTFLCCRSSDSFNLLATFKRVWKYSPDT